MEDASVDICLISTVLHTLDLRRNGAELLEEILRVLKPGGRFVTIDCKKEDTGFGPPLHVRISPDELEGMVLRHDFMRSTRTDLGHFFMSQFISNAGL